MNRFQLCFQFQLAPLHKGMWPDAKSGRSRQLLSPEFAEQALSVAYPALNQAHGRGLHWFTFRLNVSAFCGIGGAFRGC